MEPHELPGLTSPRWSLRAKRTVAFVLLVLIFLLGLQLLQAWAIVVIALVLSYLLYPVVNSIERQVLGFLPGGELRRSLAVLLTFLLGIVSVALAFLILIPPIIAQIQDLSTVVESIESELERQLDRPLALGNQTIIIWDELQNLTEGEDSAFGSFDLADTFSQAASTLSTPVFSAATLAFGFVIDALFVLAMMFYLLKDGGKFVDAIETYVPPDYKGDFRRLLYELSRIWNATYAASCLLGLMVGTATGVGATILGLPQPLVLGVIGRVARVHPQHWSFHRHDPWGHFCAHLHQHHHPHPVRHSLCLCGVRDVRHHSAERIAVSGAARDGQ
ncbi:MAG: AI-2E family transporter [Anaerolineae bacterium]|nr:AI-2E family transporter [Anaerolineae bacterium]